MLGGTVAWHAEIDPAACRVLAHHWRGVPNLGDVAAVDWTQVRPVDVLVGGFPCQDLSAAGKRAGLSGARSGLWAHMAAAIDVLRPQLVIIENVRGLLSADATHPAHTARAVEPCPWCVGDAHARPLRALGAVAGDLADVGYDAAWTTVAAADVGAPHRRERVFVAAWPAADTDGVGRGGWPGMLGPGRGGQPADRRRPAADTAGDGRHEGRAEPARLVGGPDAALGGDAAADPDGVRRAGVGRVDPGGRDPDRRHSPDGLWGVYEPAVRRWETVTGRPAPAPTEAAPRGGRRLSPAFVEWMMGLPAGHVTAVPGVTRNDRLKMLGNGVVPQQAAHAVARLLGSAAAVAGEGAA